MAQVLAPNRRAVLRGSAAVLLAVGTTAAASTDAVPDAELFAAYAAFARAEEDVTRLEEVDDAPDTVFEAALDTLQAAIVQVSGLKARTTAGVCAKARVCQALLAMDEPDVRTARIGGTTRRHDVLARSTLSTWPIC